jgi:hypothetical protein
MRPPVCRICREDLKANSGGLLYFKKNDSDLKWDKRMENEMMVGHPPYCDWFCDAHIEEAKELQHLEITEAVKILKNP